MISAPALQTWGHKFHSRPPHCASWRRLKRRQPKEKRAKKKNNRWEDWPIRREDWLKETSPVKWKDKIKNKLPNTFSKGEQKRRNANHSLAKGFCRSLIGCFTAKGREHTSLHRPACSDLVFCVDGPMTQRFSPGAGQSSTGRLQTQVATMWTDYCY